MPNDHPVAFNVSPLTSQSAVERHISLNEARGLPEALSPRTAFLAASGPSLALEGPESLWLRHEAEPDIPILAVNGALSVLLARDVVPTWWAACDGQPRVADFLSERPAQTTYLVASRCHPDVFERLRGRHVRVWRLDDEPRNAGSMAVQHAISVTLCAQNLLRLMGFNRVECWGWDGCFSDDGSAYADGSIKDAGICQLAIGETVFATTHEWMAEGRDAVIQAANWKAMGYELIAHGLGAMGAMLRARGLSGM